MSQTTPETVATPQTTGGKQAEKKELPFFVVPQLAQLPQEEFDPALHLEKEFILPASLPSRVASVAGEGDNGDFLHRALLPLAYAAKHTKGKHLVPRVEDCHSLWDKYGMLENIRAHCTCVAAFGVAMAELAVAKGMAVNCPLVLAAGLLHDIAKTYTIRHKGNHAQLGAGWVMQETRNPLLAHAVLHHVHWPWDHALEGLVANDAYFATVVIMYADKRVMHDRFVPLEERFEDLLLRYGKTAHIRQSIMASLEQGKHIEQALSRRLGVSLHEHTLDSGRLVYRA